MAGDDDLGRAARIERGGEAQRLSTRQPAQPTSCKGTEELSERHSDDREREQQQRRVEESAQIHVEARNRKENWDLKNAM